MDLRLLIFVETNFALVCEDFLCLNVPSTSDSFSALALRPASWLAYDVCSGHYYEWIRFLSRTDLGIEMSGVWDEWSQLLILWPHCKGNAGAGYSVIRHGPGAASHLRVSLYLEKSSRVNWAQASACLGHLFLPVFGLPRILRVLWCWQYYQGYTTTNRKMTDLQQILCYIVHGTWDMTACGPRA